MNTRTLTIGTALAALSMVGTLALTHTAQASASGRKNTAIGLGALAVQQLLSGKTTNGVVVGAGAAYAYKRYQDAQRDEKRKERISEYSRTQSSTSRRTSRSRYGGTSVNSRSRQVNSAHYSAAGTNRGRYGSFVFTGPVSNDATELVNRKITVDHNGILRPVSVPKDAVVIQAGQTASVHDLREGDIVRVTADKTGENSWKATRIEVLKSRELEPRVSTRAGSSTYVERSEALAHYSGVGIVQDVAEDGRSFVIKAGSNLRTIYVSDANFNGIASASDLQRGDRVRVTGDLDQSDVMATEINLLD